MKKHTNLTKKRLQKAAKKHPVVQLSITGKLTNVFVSVSEAARSTKANRYVIIRCCRSSSSFYTSGGYRWRYLKDVDINQLLREQSLN